MWMGMDRVRGVGPGVGVDRKGWVWIGPGV